MKKESRVFEAIIVGGSYSGLAAGMALGRALRRVLIIDAGIPCNRQTPYAHNFITHDGKAPGEISKVARQQVERYDTVSFFSGLATKVVRVKDRFLVHAATGETFDTGKLILATGIKDIMSNLRGYSECWGISVLHCPYCHGYEVRNTKTAVLGNGDHGFEFAALVSNWTKELTLLTNGPSTLTPEQTTALAGREIKIEENVIKRLVHHGGHIQNIIFDNADPMPVNVLYVRSPFEQQIMPGDLECEMTDDGYIKTDPSQKTSVAGLFACGDNTTRMRTIANAVAQGTTAGMVVNKELVLEKFKFPEKLRS